MLDRRALFASTAGAVAFPPFLSAQDAAVDTAIKPDIAADHRLKAAKTLNDYFPFTVPQTLAEWETRRAELKTQVKVSLGLWPEPPKDPLNATIHGKIERVGYTIEKVFFASAPGHYVTGSLYRPHGSSIPIGKRPAVIFAHGHWNNGRFHEAAPGSVTNDVKSGAEPNETRAKFFMQAIPITLARQGYVCFQLDMIGYADSKAIPHIAKSGVPHPEGFADAEGELRLQSLLGLQVWNCIRAIDFLETLPDVDAKKIGMTGASGGGSQTFLTAAVDDRLAAAFPAVMVSTAMQGGCVCENASLLRVNTGNIELAALFAPKPLAMSAAKDWTQEIMTKGFPELKALYTLYGKPENVAAKAWLEYGHNYNRHAREMMYNWFETHLNGKPDVVKEEDYEPTPVKELSVFDEKHPRPQDELNAKRFRERYSAAADAQLAQWTPKTKEQLKKFQDVVAPALKAMVISDLPKSIAVRKGPVESKPDGCTMHLAVFGRVNEKDAVACAGIFNKKFTGEKVLMWVHPQGKASLFDKGKLVPAARLAVEAGYAVVAPDCHRTGEMVNPAVPYKVNTVYAGFTFGYNRTLLANRVHDILTAVCFAKTMLKAKTINMVGWEEAGPWAILARAIAGATVDKLAAEVNGFRFDKVTTIEHEMMLPGALKYGGLGAMLAVAAPGVTLITGVQGSGTGMLSKAGYFAAGAEKNLTANGAKMTKEEIASWVVK